MKIHYPEILEHFKKKKGVEVLDSNILEIVDWMISAGLLYDVKRMLLKYHNEVGESNESCYCMGAAEFAVGNYDNAIEWLNKSNLHAAKEMIVLANFEKGIK
jgi:hypothetical protein